MVPATEVHAIERCSGHDGTYAVKSESYDASMKIVRPVVNQVKRLEPDHYTSDCPMAGSHIAHGLGPAGPAGALDPMSLLRLAYGI